MKQALFLLSIITVSAIVMTSCNSVNSNANETATSSDSMVNNSMTMQDNSMADLSGWPEAGRMAVEEITAKYGKADGMTANEFIWMDKGVWKKISISKAESKHSFPIEHTDMMTSAIMYDVPEDKMDDLGKFDGSVTFDRTQGTMSARCDIEANNFLALNLANDIITGKKSVEEARKAFGEIVKEKMNGGDPAYMQKLSFSVQPAAADPDINTTGLTKEDVVKGIESNKMKK